MKKKKLKKKIKKLKKKIDWYHKRKTLRLLDWIVSDIDEAKKKLEAVIDDDLSNNDELQEEAEEAEQEIVEARRKILHASDTLRQIYNECYED